MTDIRVAAEQARVALTGCEQVLTKLVDSDMARPDSVIGKNATLARAALASLEAALAALPGDKIERDGFGPRTPLRWPAQPPTAAVSTAGVKFERHVFSYGDSQNKQDLVHSAATPAVEVPQIAGRDGASAAPSDEGSAWQPIETAPKDGTQVIAWLPWLGTGVLCRWSKARGTGWVCSFVGFSSRIEREPTYWMPMPTPPRQVAHSSQAQGELSVNSVVTNNDRMNEENQNG